MYKKARSFAGPLNVREVEIVNQKTSGAGVLPMVGRYRSTRGSQTIITAQTMISAMNSSMKRFFFAPKAVSCRWVVGVRQ